MNRLFTSLLFAAVVLLAPAQAEERILKYLSDITVEIDGGIEVIETIQVRAEGNQIKRGIYRDFPTLYGGKSAFALKKARIPFDVLEVTRNGHPEPFQLESITGGKRVRIGNANKFIKGEQTYTIRYRTAGQLGFHEEHDELYWNVTGNDWIFPIDHVEATVHLPEGIEATSSEGYTGAIGSKHQDYTTRIDGEGTAHFATTRPLFPGEGLTIVTTFAKGQITPTESSTWRANLGLILAACGTALLAFYHLFAWLLVGKDPQKGTIIPQFAPPEGFSPGACRYLMNMGYDDTTFASGVIDLATRGKISIEQEDKKSFTLHKTDDQGADDLPEDETALYEKLLSRNKLKLSQKNHRTIRAGRSAMERSLAQKLEKTHFAKNFKFWFPALLISLLPILAIILHSDQPVETGFFMVFATIWCVVSSVIIGQFIGALWKRNWGTAASTAIFAVAFGGAGCFLVFMLSQVISVYALVLLLFIAILNAIFYHLIKARTHAGRKILDHIEGFKQYLSVAEEERLNLQNPPEKTPELFERFLPYALALDCEQEWSEKFESVLAAAAAASPQGGHYRPHFYTGNYHRELSAAALGSALGAGLTNTLSNSSRAPGSSSGSGGGGSSGGGGGGGGGGGW